MLSGSNLMVVPARQNSKIALVVVDVQNDFCQGGSLAVNGSLQVIENLNKLIDLEQKNKIFQVVVFTKDWHPQHHISFANSHQNAQPFTVIQHQGKDLDLWPIHCIQGSQGAKIHPNVKLLEHFLYVNKGEDIDEECYSGFGTARKPTDLKKILKQNKIQTVIVVGLAYDFCVGSTALNARQNGFKVVILKDCTKGVLRDLTNQMQNRLKERHIQHKTLKQIIDLFVII